MFKKLMPLLLQALMVFSVLPLTQVVAQAIAIHDCQGFLRSKAVVEEGATKTVTVELSEQPAVNTRVLLKNIDTLQEIAANSTSSNLVFSEVPVGNYILVAEQNSLLVSTISFSSAGITAGALALATGGALVAGAEVHEATNGNAPSSSDTDTPTPPATTDCNCDPEAVPEALTPEDFFAAKGQAYKLQKISAVKQKSEQFESGFLLNRMSMNWWNTTAEERRQNAESKISSAFRVGELVNPNSFSLTTSDGQSGQNARFVAKYRALTFANDTNLSLATAIAQADSLPFANNNAHYLARGLIVEHVFSRYLTGAFASSILSKENLDTGKNTQATHSVFSLQAPLSEHTSAQLFYSKITSNDASEEERTGLTVGQSLNRYNQIAFLVSKSLNQESDSRAEILWSILLK